MNMVSRITAPILLSVALAFLLGTAGTGNAVTAAGFAGQVEGWREDLNLYETELPRRHANAFHHISGRDFHTKVSELRQRLPDIDADQFWVGLDQIENAIGDGHTFMRMPADAPRFGLDLKQFGDDYRVVAVAPGVRDGILGTRLVAIDGMPLREVRKRILTLTPQDELQSLRDFRSQALLTNGLVLHGLGITASRDTATYQLKDDAGQRIDLVVHVASLAPRDAWTTLAAYSHEKTSDQPMHCEVDGAKVSVICQFRSYDDLEHTSAELFDTVRKSRARRLIIDIRENNGGNFCKGLQYLVQPIAADTTLNRRGALYLLIGQQTFSAAMSNAAHFRQLTQATLVGEPIGEKPNSYQEIEDLHLTHTGWDARYSSRFYKFADGRENIIRPDILIKSTWQDYKQGRDAALIYVLRQPLAEGAINGKGVAAHIQPAGEQYCS